MHCTALEGDLGCGTTYSQVAYKSGKKSVLWADEENVLPASLQLHCAYCINKSLSNTVSPQSTTPHQKESDSKQVLKCLLEGCSRYKCYQYTVPWLIFLAISCSLFCCFHNFISWKVCSCEPCLCLIRSIFSVLSFVPGKLSASKFSQLGTSKVGTANLNKASSHRVTSEIKKKKNMSVVVMSVALLVSGVSGVQQGC